MLITALCAHKDIVVEPKLKIRSSIDKKFIDHHCTNPEKNPDQRNKASSPLASPSSPTLEVVERIVMRHILHLEDQQSAMCRFFMQIYHGMRDQEYMNLEEQSSYMNCPGDRPSSVRGAKNANAEVHSTTGNVARPKTNHQQGHHMWPNMLMRNL